MNTKISDNLKYTKVDDLKDKGEVIQDLDLSPFIGAWDNTKKDSGQLPYVEMREEGGTLYLKAFGAEDSGLMEWGEVECEVFTENTYNGTAIAFITRYAFDDIDVEFTANVKLGVLVIQTYTKFRDESKRLNYYVREFFGPAQS
jgi:hypothetical protein